MILLKRLLVVFTYIIATVCFIVGFLPVAIIYIPVSIIRFLIWGEGTEVNLVLPFILAERFEQYLLNPY